MLASIYTGILSIYVVKDVDFVHFLDFFNWNKVKIRYCDGASLSGHPETELKVSFGFSYCVFNKTGKNLF